MSNLKIVAGPVDRLGEIIAERAAAQKQLAENAATLAKVDEFDRAAAAVKSEIEGLAEREASALRDWTVAGCRGPAPEPLTEERTAAVKRLVAAQAASEPGPRTRADVESQNSILTARVREIDVEVESLILDALEAKFSAKREALRASMAAVRGHFADALGIREVLLTHARQMAAKGRDDEARSIFQRAERLQILGDEFDATPTGSAVEASARMASCYESSLRAGGSK